MGFWASNRWVSGVTSGALVPLRTTSRLTGGGVVTSVCPELYGIVIRPIAAGVGVAGGVLLDVLFFFGVDGLVSLDSAFWAGILRFLLMFATLFGTSTSST
jgi:hypothetical protein